MLKYSASSKSSRNVDAASSTVVVEIEHNFYQSISTCFPILTFNYAIYGSNRKYRECRWMIFFTNRIFQRVITIHISIAGEQQHALCLGKLPDYAVGACKWQINDCKGDDTDEVEIEPTCGCKRAPQQGHLALNVMIGKEGDHDPSRAALRA